MPKRGALLLALAVLLVAAPALALDPRRAVHQYVSRTWTVNDGLPQSSVKATTQTPDGYLWAATEEGLVRFDGARFTVFSESDVDEITNNDMADLCVDRAGALWIASRGGGVLRYQGGAFKAWRITEGLVDDFTVKVACGADGDVWVGTTRGVSHLHEGKISSLALKDGLPSESVNALLVDADDTGWVGTDGGLARIAGGKVAATYTESSGFPMESVTALYRLDADHLLVGGRGVIASIDRAGAVTTYAGEGVLPNRNITAMLHDQDGNLWVGTHESGLRRLAPDGTWSAFGVAQGLADDVVQSLFEDREGDVWIGTESKGMQRLANAKVVTYDRFDGITGAMVRTVFEDKDGAIWIGTRGAGVHRRAPDGTVRTYSIKDGLPSDTVYSVAQAADGAMWFGTMGGGAARLSGDTFRVWDTKHGLAHDFVRAVLPDSHGNVWIGTEGGGLDRLEGEKITHYTAGGVLASNSVRMITEDRTGTVWFGTEGGGITRWDGERFATIRKVDGLSDDSVVSVTLDDDGTLWFGSYHGLTRMRDGRFVRATMREGLFNNIVFTTLNGPGDTIFMSSNMGISEISRKDFDDFARGVKKHVTSKVFGIADGMKIAECNGGSPSGIRARDGKLWFANMAGAVMIDPSAIKPNSLPPPVVIESVLVNRHEVKIEDPIRLEPGSRDFEFNYTAMSFVEPERVTFRYKLVGSDQDWVEAGARRTAYYTNLAPGDYTFQVIAANNDGVWNDTGARLRVHLAPHFYETWPFYGAVAAAVLLLGAGIFRARVAQLRAYSRELERRVAARTAELGEALRSLEAKDKRIHEDLEQARAFQQGILPKKLPARAELRVGVCYTPADLVGGDVYDVCELEGGTVRVFLADTTGHGVQASLRTMVLRTEYDALKRTPRSPAEVLEALNRRLFARYQSLEMRCNAICFDVVPADGQGAKVTFANCAQPPMLHAKDGAVEEVYEKGPFLAMTEEIELAQAEVRLAKGERLLVFTDGVFEQEDGKGEQFGFERMNEVLVDRALDPAEVTSTLCARVKAFAGKSPDDDITILCVEV